VAWFWPRTDWLSFTHKYRKLGGYDGRGKLRLTGAATVNLQHVIQHKPRAMSAVRPHLDPWGNAPVRSRNAGGGGHLQRLLSGQPPGTGVVNLMRAESLLEHSGFGAAGYLGLLGHLDLLSPRIQSIASPSSTGSRGGGGASSGQSGFSVLPQALPQSCALVDTEWMKPSRHMPPSGNRTKDAGQKEAQISQQH